METGCDECGKNKDTIPCVVSQYVESSEDDDDTESVGLNLCSTCVELYKQREFRGDVVHFKKEM
ncbi:MAG: hypothetical protein GY774_00345 [Planctomycetes bacterium]|nr:hypothetical protein [Planctomycetota bacterium]